MDSPEASVSESPAVRLAEGDLLVASPVTMTEACFAAPAIRALRNHRPEHRLTVGCPQTLAAFWQTLEGIGPVISWPDQAKARAIVGLITECGIDFSSALAWEHSQASLAFARLGIAQRVGWGLCGRKDLTDPLALPDTPGPPQHRVRFYLDALGALGIDGYVPASFHVPALPERPSPPRVALLPGSDRGPAYCWGVERFHELGELVADETGAEVLLLAVPGHATEANEVAALLGDRARNYANEFELGVHEYALQRFRADAASGPLDYPVGGSCCHNRMPPVAFNCCTAMGLEPGGIHHSTNRLRRIRHSLQGTFDF